VHLAVILGLWATVGLLPGDVTPKQTEPAVAVADPLEGPPVLDQSTWNEIARAILLTAIPDHYEDRKHWGRTRSVFDGYDIQQRGFNLRVKERRRQVNDGAWYRVTVRCPHPERNLQMTLGAFQVTGAGRTAFTTQIRLRGIQLHGHFEHWVLGVKGLNFDLESEVEVRIQAVIEVALQTEFQKGRYLPDLVLKPAVTSLRLELADVNLKRIGRVGGPLIEDLGDTTRQIFVDLLHQQEPRVLRKANEAIQKKKDTLRIPVSKL